MTSETATAVTQCAAEMRSLIRDYGWKDTPLGDPGSWPPPLQSALSLCLDTPLVAAVHWGPELTTLYNDAYAPALATKHPWALGRPFSEVWSEIWDVLGSQIDKVIATGGGFATERQYLQMERRGRVEDTWWVYSFAPIRGDDCLVAGIFVTALETTDAALAEQRQEASLRLYENIVQSDSSPVCAFDHDYRVVGFNKSQSDEFFRVFGHRIQVGDLFPALFPPDQEPVIRGFMTRALAGESYMVIEEFGDPDLAKPHWEVSYHQLRDQSGQIVGAFHHARDISARLKGEEDLTTAQDALRQSQKMEAIGQLTGGVAHDFNNLLTVIRGSVDLLRRADLPPERRERYIDAIGDTADRAAKLTGQLLAFARRQALMPELFDVGSSIENVSTMVRTLAGSRIRLDVNPPNIPLFVMADRGQLDTAIVNLSINARDAMNGEGALSISIGAVSNLPARRVHEQVIGDFVAIAVTDQGVGISEENLERVFEPFFTTKDTGNGTGLGLSQVIGFAKQSGGDVTVESVQGQGTTFTLYLPRVAADGIPDAEPLIDVRSDGAGVCVLVAEDNADVGEFATSALKELGYDSVLARNAEQALVELERDCARFHILFTDVVMPGASGVELAQAVRRDYPHLPIILTSGYSHVLAENGSHGFELLHKPYSVDQLSRVLQKAIAWHQRQESR